MTELHPRIRTELLDSYKQMSADGTLPAPSQFQGYFELFRRKFGPEVLRSLDGQPLLELMHAHGTVDSLVYWLEFKDDEEFPALFGSIAGGSALKFGVYRRAETGTWATKSSGNNIQDISVQEAIEIARRHRDQLLAAVELISKVPENADDARYLTLQHELARIAPDVQNLAWGHKYLSLIFPTVLDSFHVPTYQHYNLVRTLQLPPLDGEDWSKGRYASAGRFVRLANALDVPLYDATILLNRRHGSPRAYWRIGTTDADRERRKYWPLMRDGNLVAVGWPLIGDLSNYADNEDSRKAIAALLQAHYPNIPQSIGKSASQLMYLIKRMTDGDRVVAADGQTILGAGEVAGPYGFDPAISDQFPHQRAVIWRSFAEWKLPKPEGLQTTVFGIKDPRNQVEIERHLLEDVVPEPTKAQVPVSTENQPPTQVSQPMPPPRGHLPRLAGTPGQVQSILERKGQAILYGPPGTGKTHWALQSAWELAAQRAFGTSFSNLDPQQALRIREGTAEEPALVQVTSFHPEYGYEDFIEGYRPKVAPNGGLAFEIKLGIFRQLCQEASANPALDFYLIIDEINRGDVPRIFGELLTVLEKDKRGVATRLPASGEQFRVPTNVFVLGTMNTADRSIALLDIALRRRFGFIELMPNYALFKGVSVGGLPLGPWLQALNRRIRSLGTRDSRNRQIGHAFLLVHGGPISTVEQLAAVLRDDIVPLLEEYAYDDFEQLTEMLGAGLVDTTAQRVKVEMWEVGRGSDLVAALHRPEISTALGATLLPAEEPEGDEGIPDDETSEEPDQQPSSRD